ncbi:MAG TPA: hypothetical protein GX396_03325 [Tissierellia bacterium]|nr:hypothetical protein [Tissierellia bacterium]
MNRQNTVDLLSEIYRGAKMGVETINNLLTKVNDNKVYDELKYQQRTYEEIANEAYLELEKRTKEIKDISLMSKISAKMSVGINTMINNSPSHVADMMIKGSTMGITSLTKNLNSYVNVDEDIKSLAERFMKIEQDNIERLKRFL